MDGGIILGWMIAAVFIGGIALLTWRGIRQYRIRQAIRAFIEQLPTEGDRFIFDQFNNRYAVSVINGKSSKKQRGIITLSASGIALYPARLPAQAAWECAPEDIRWFGRPEPYGPATNEIWLHVERKRDWLLVKIWLGQGQMMDFVRLLKTLVDPELVTAYRRRRPYIHHGPVSAQPAEQDIHGAWTLQSAVSLYLMPRYLLILYGDAVQQMLPLASIQQISALRRLDAPTANGLVRFQTPEAQYAFATTAYEALAQALAEAAKRTLEAPVMQKQKGKDGAWDDAD